MLITQADIDRIKKRIDLAETTGHPRELDPLLAFRSLPVDLLIALACGILDATQMAMDELGDRGIVPDEDL